MKNYKYMIKGDLKTISSEKLRTKLLGKSWIKEEIKGNS